jgi:predicted class III extradiol MEMO1 family dioxygenase
MDPAKMHSAYAPIFSVRFDGRKSHHVRKICCTEKPVESVLPDSTTFLSTLTTVCRMEALKQVFESKQAQVCGQFPLHCDLQLTRTSGCSSFRYLSYRRVSREG